MVFGTRFYLLEAFFILQLINKVYSSYCDYYPNYPTNYISYTTYCSSGCCGGYPTTANGACCSSYFPFFIVPIIIIGIIFVIVLPITIFTCCILKKKRQIRQQAMMAQIGSTVPITQPYTIGYNPNPPVYNMNTAYNPSLPSSFNYNQTAYGNNSSYNQISFGNNPSYGLTPTASNVPNYDPYATASMNPIQQKNSFF